MVNLQSASIHIRGVIAFFSPQTHLPGVKAHLEGGKPFFLPWRWINGGVKSSEQGVSLIESLLVVVIIGAVVFLLASLPNALVLIAKSKHVSLAREIAVKQIEDKRTINYSNLVNDNSPINDSRLSLLPQGNGTVAVEPCSPLICTNEEHIKQVTVAVSWVDNNTVQTISLKTMIGEGGINQ